MQRIKSINHYLNTSVVGDVIGGIGLFAMLIALTFCLASEAEFQRQGGNHETQQH